MFQDFTACILIIVQYFLKTAGYKRKHEKSLLYAAGLKLLYVRQILHQ